MGCDFQNFEGRGFPGGGLSRVNIWGNVSGNVPIPMLD